MAMYGTDSTLLRIDGFAISAYASRGMSQTLAPIGASADIRRTVNGELRNFSDDVFHKYASTITGRDQRPPSMDGIWAGATVTVECAALLSFKTGGSASRDVVDDSAFIEGDLTFYRPKLTMMVMSFDSTFDEWAADWSWTIVLEEV